MGIREELDIRPVINAAATLTKLGGSIMPPEVVRAMGEASTAFLDLYELQEKAGARLASLTHNEAGFICNGAAAGITLTVAACMAGTDPDLAFDFPYLEEISKDQVIIYRGQRNPYDYAARMTGARIVEIEPERGELEDAISDRTACVLFFAGALEREARPIEEVIAIAHARDVPVIVDAAAQIPPVANFWRYTRDLGADAIIISGGKGLRGPQSSGLILGSKEMIEGCRANAAPNQRIGRPMKVGKEEMAGILKAVELMVSEDDTALFARYEVIVASWIKGLSGMPGVLVERGYPSEAGQPHGRAIVRLSPKFPLARDEVIDRLWNRNPRVAVNPVEDDAIGLNPQPLMPGEETIVLKAVREVLAQAK